jgi:hypothetical protein
VLQLPGLAQLPWPHTHNHEPVCHIDHWMWEKSLEYSKVCDEPCPDIITLLSALTLAMNGIADQALEVLREGTDSKVLV